ncbi:MAG: carbohydrate ABC transporter permease [Acutalibacteraceae bacterium]|jgi:raffinose/stachyose/melibiose transport system permease protein
MEKSYKKYSALFLLPTLLAFTIAFALPFVAGFLLSFAKFTTVTDAEFVGISNYIKAFADDKTFLNSLMFTVKFAFLTVITINVFAFLLALILTKSVPATKVFRTIFFMPNLIGGIVLGYIWQVIINGVLLKYNYSITSDPKFGFFGLVILMNWQMIGYTMIIYIAGIQNISGDILESAEVDGAGSVMKLRKIIIPSVMPSITICLFLTITNSFKLFDQNLALTAGAPADKTQMLALNIYNTFYARNGYEGVGQAKAVIFFIIVALIALIQLWLTRRKEVES